MALADLSPIGPIPGDVSCRAAPSPGPPPRALRHRVAGDRTAPMADGTLSSPPEGAPSRMPRLRRRSNRPHSASRAIPDGRMALITCPAEGAVREPPISGKFLRLLRLLPGRRDSRFSGYRQGSPRSEQNPEASEPLRLPGLRAKDARPATQPEPKCARGEEAQEAQDPQGRRAGKQAAPGEPKKSGSCNSM